MRPKQYQQLASTLEALIRTDPAFELPSLTVLCHRFNVSYPTMWRAVQVLQRAGVVVAPSGKKIAIAPGVRPGVGVDENVVSSLDRVYAVVKQRISDGVYQMGRQVPKIGFFAVSEHVSPVTVSRAFFRLAEEGLLHRNKRRWIVGPALQATAQTEPRVSADQGPVVLVLINAEGDAQHSFDNSFNNAFMMPFRAEIMAGNIHMRMVARQDSPVGDLLLPTGLDGLRSTATALGERYWGCLIHSVRPDLDELHTWVHAASALGKPVVYFDPSGDGGSITRRGLPGRKNFYRLFLDDRAAVNLAVAELARLGHRTILLHGVEVYAVWAERRARFIEEAAAVQSPPLRVIRCAPAEDSWGFVRGDGSSSIAADTARSFDIDAHDLRRAGRLTAFRSSLIDKADSLASPLREHAPTAIIALNDGMAREYFFWFRALGVQVPEDISIISFDNQPSSVFFPISTIDFGFSRLGYLAAHILRADLAVRADRLGGVPGTCSLVDQGSLAPPTQEPGRLRSLLGESGRVVSQSRG